MGGARTVATIAQAGLQDSTVGSHTSKGPLSGEEPSEILGWAAVPPKLLKKILSLDYIDMWELLPESWRLEQQAEGCCRSQRPKWKLITDLTLWTECYTALVVILAFRYPRKTTLYENNHTGQPEF